MNQQMYRKKSVERITSPEQLNDYVRVSNPGVWMILIAVLVLLAGVCVWGIFGRLDSKIQTVAIAESGMAICYVREADIAAVKEGQSVVLEERTFPITAISDQPFSVNEALGDYALHLGGLTVGEWVYEVTALADLPDGIYDATITVDSVAPISFIFN